MATRSDKVKAKPARAQKETKARAPKQTKPRAQSSRNAGAQGNGGPTGISRNLKGIRFPADRRQLVQQARSNGASSDVIRRIQEMPDRAYANMAEVMKGSAGKK